ncbi:MAG: hypothetical protein IJU80_01050 [Lachnospiraceae bacterium]|nr:hypothetical protein [Lachnospiraceae bacterium]
MENMLKGKNKEGNSRQNPNWNKNRMVAILLITVLVVASIISLIVVCLRSAEKKRLLQESEASMAASEEAFAQELSRTSARLEYNNLYEEYVVSLDDCNKAIQEYNAFLSDIEIYSFEKMPNSVELINSTWPAFEDYYIAGANKELLKNLIEELKENLTGVEMLSADASLIAYNVAVNDYNTVLDAYLTQTKKVSLDFLEGVQTNQRKKKTMTKWVRNIWNRADAVSRIRYVVNETKELATIYYIANQLENPSKEWVIERLLEVNDIVQCLPVSKGNDPNGLLSLDGGYTSCVYFTITSVPPGSVQGGDPVTKGTDGGGAIEVYATVEDAKCRCDYLGQYDGTLLYSGSYAILGTMVIRTSYLLSNKEQIDLTNTIMEKFTEIR